jgi:hypothetical protein
MFPTRKDMAYGVSLAPAAPGEVHIWMDNQTDQPQSVYFCCGGTFEFYIELYDGTGNRVPTTWEAKNGRLRDPGFGGIVCSCSGFVVVPPHTLGAVDSGQLGHVYALPPGRYTITERPLPTTSPAISIPSTEPSKTIPSPTPSLTISIP